MGNSKFDSIIDDVILKETGGRPNGGYTNDPADAGGRTQYGVSEKANPQAWLDGKVTEEEARAIYLQKYVIWPKFHTIPAQYGDLQRQLIDFGVLSGHYIAIQKLQKVIGAKEDGVLGPKTLERLASFEPREVNNKVVIERLLMNGRICKKDPSQLKYLDGWNVRAASFFVA